MMKSHHTPRALLNALMGNTGAKLKHDEFAARAAALGLEVTHTPKKKGKPKKAKTAKTTPKKAAKKKTTKKGKKIAATERKAKAIVHELQDEIKKEARVKAKKKKRAKGKRVPKGEAINPNGMVAHPKGKNGKPLHGAPLANWLKARGLTKKNLRKG